MTDIELSAITEALRKAKRGIDFLGWTERRAIFQLGIAVELLADVVYRMGKR